MQELQALPTPMLVALGVLVVVQLGLEIYAIVDIIRRPADRIVGGNKILWVLLVLFVNLIGAIVYLVVGRKPAAAAEAVPTAPAAQRAADAADMLYGPREAQVPGHDSAALGGAAPDGAASGGDAS